MLSAIMPGLHLLLFAQTKKKVNQLGQGCYAVKRVLLTWTKKRF